MTTTSKLIICVGDSFTAGDELAADLLIPGYTSNLHSNVKGYPPTHAKLYTELQSLMLPMFMNGKFSAFEQACKNKAWPAHLQNLLDAEVINCARFGISNPEIVNRAINTYNSKLEKYKPKDITVLIMPTHINRLGHPVYNEANEVVNFKSINAHWNTNEITPAYLRPVFEYQLKHYKDNDFMWASISQLKSAEEYFKLEGSNVLFLESGMWGWSFKDVAIDQAALKRYYKMIKISARMLEISEVCERILPGHHYNEEVHIEFATKVASIL
jgi:hypothetical protein